MDGVIKRTTGGVTKFVARPYDPALRDHVWLGTFTDELDAAIAVRDHFAGGGAYKDKIRIDQLVDEWIELHVSTLKSYTQQVYRQNIKPFREAFAGVVFDSLKYDELQRWSNSVKRHNRLAARYVFTWALDAEKISRNPMVKISVARTPQRMPQALTADEVRELAQKSFDVHHEPMATRIASMILFAAGSGLRPSEFSRLLVEHVDRAAGIVYVEPSKNWKDGRIAILPLAHEALDLLPAMLPGQLLYGNTKGKPLAKSGISHWFSPVRAAAGKPDFPFQNLRHTCGTIMAEAGISAAAIAKQMRHSDTGATAERYYIRPHEQNLLAEVNLKLGSGAGGGSPIVGRIAVAGGADVA